MIPEIPRLNLKDGLWRYAIIGGVASIPLSLSFYWLSGMGNRFSSSMIFFGGLLSGYLAQKHSRKPATAGIGAGIIGGLPGYVWILPQLVRTARAWPSPIGSVAVLALSVPVIIAIAALPGLIGGFVGGWFAEKVGRKQVAAANS